MQMNAEFKEEQIGTPFVWVGALEGGVGGGGAKGGPIQKIHVTYNTFFFPPSCWIAKFFSFVSERKDPVAGILRM